MREPDPNLAVYRSSDAVRSYDGKVALSAAETSALGDLDPRVRHGRVLDLGVGGGRTVPALARGARSYVGLDYAEEMVRLARAAHPGVRFEVADARDLSRFDDDAFDLVVFSFNGIDYVDHDDRQRVLAEVRRVLAGGGVFIFSSHNRDYERFNLLPFQRQRRFGRRTVLASLRCLRYLPRHRRMRRREVHTEEYAVVNDGAHEYRLMTYYVTPAAQRIQLARYGFTHVVAYDARGRVTTGDPASVQLYYAARGSTG